jgi:site-specific DNA-methyltransferase (adenine-specific)
MEYMKTVPDKHFDLAIVDPPYGLDIANSPRICLDKGIKGKDWDKIKPKADYFNELFRVSKEQIIWGGNYFVELWRSPCKGFIVWYKFQPTPSFADCEFAWTSFDKPAKCFNFRYYGNLEGDTSATKKIHPTQKPVDLYKWLLKNYAIEGMKILDTHLGSGSIAIACHDYGFELTACEIDKDYYDAAVKRYSNHIAQTSLF